MQVNRYGYTWTIKESGYYQSTTNFPDGTRHWLHQEVYSREVGELKAGHHIHHLDEDKDNNEASNLEQLLGVEHAKLHMQNPELLQKMSEAMVARNAEMQLLAIAAKNGEYISKNKLRQLQKGSKHRDCGFCGTRFTLKITDRNDTKYCCNLCAQRASKTARDPSFKILANELNCVVCNTTFNPLVGNQVCCSVTCQKENTEFRRKNDLVTRQCYCGENYEIPKSSKRKYCSDACRERARTKIN